MEAQQDLIEQIRTDGQLHSLVLQLKSCPVCSTLNRIDSESCIVCTWQGKFDIDVALVSSSLERLLIKCPELLHTLVPEKKASMLDKLKAALFRKRTRDRLDLQA